MSVQTAPSVELRGGHIAEAEVGEWARRVVEETPDAIVTIDATGEIVQLNRAAEELLGYARDELLGETFGELLVPQGRRADFWSCLLSTVSGEGPGERVSKIRAMRRGGDELPANLVTVRTSDSPVLVTIFMRRSGLGAHDPREGLPSSPKPSEREREVLALAAEGHSGPQIAERLVISPATVKSHFENIYEKLGVANRGAAVAKALRLGLIS